MDPSREPKPHPVIDQLSRLLAQPVVMLLVVWWITK